MRGRAVQDEVEEGSRNQLTQSLQAEKFGCYMTGSGERMEGLKQVSDGI